MDRRNILGLAGPAAMAAVIATANLATSAQAAPGDRFRYHRRRGRHRAGLLLKDVEGVAGFGRRRGEFEGDCLLQSLHWGRKLHVSGLLEGEADLEGRRLDFELEVDDERFRRVGADLSERRGRVSLDLAEIEVGRRLEVDLDSVRLHDIRGPHGDRLEYFLAQLAEAIEDEDGHRRHRGGDQDIDDLVGAINLLLAHHLHVVDPDRRRG